MRFVAWMVAMLVLLAGCGGSDLGQGCPGSSPAPPDVSGVWSVSEAEIVTSTCAQNINQELLALVTGPTGTCAFDVDQDGNNIIANECHDATMFGCVDGAGEIRGTLDLFSTTMGCTTSADIVFTANSATSPSSAEYDITVSFSGQGCGVLTNCQAVIATLWED